MSDTALDFVAAVQQSDWDRLRAAIDRAANGYWSMDVESVILRIRKACTLVAPTDVGEVPWEIFASGLYDEVLKGIARAEPDPRKVEGYREIMSGRMDQSLYASCVRAAGRLRDKGIDTIG